MTKPLLLPGSCPRPSQGRLPPVQPLPAPGLCRRRGSAGLPGHALLLLSSVTLSCSDFPVRVSKAFSRKVFFRPSGTDLSMFKGASLVGPRPLQRFLLVYGPVGAGGPRHCWAQGRAAATRAPAHLSSPPPLPRTDGALTAATRHLHFLQFRCHCFGQN